MQKNALNDLILAKINELGGKMPFSIFMQLALYAPGLGYYANGLQKFGPTGDFSTAPEISPLFGKCIIPSIQDFDHILEFGPGTGALSKTLLENHPHIEKYWILEISAELQARQKETLKEYLHKITWLTELPAKPFKGAIVANEIIDAFPATKFLWKDNNTYEYFVTEKNGEFCFTTDTPSSTAITEFVKTLELPNNYSSEMHLWLKPWIKSLSECLTSGIILIIDYGFPRHELYHPDRDEGTLMCHYQHHAHPNVLEKPGEQDITAHIDFTAVAEAAVENNLDVAGYTSQAAFLLDNDLLALTRGAQDAKAIDMLTSPAEMGEFFKVMALTKNWDKPIAGFRMQDRRHRL
ncbi:MAG TPA: SAM-dependent methyltransferase [Gammaproteobacteria bacterium]|nr:SAM-dependent methyltransferase [Gammaproteobacteria bacterium]